MEPANRLMRHLAFFTLVIGVSAAVIFLSVPQIDIWVASQFKTETAFVLSNTDLAYFQKKLIRYLTILSALSVTLGTIIAHVRQQPFLLSLSLALPSFQQAPLAFLPGLWSLLQAWQPWAFQPFPQRELRPQVRELLPLS